MTNVLFPRSSTSIHREDLGDLTAFVVVADEQSFTRAAAKLGTSQSALSHAIRRLEARLNLRLLTRTTRSVGLTEAGAQLIETVRPALAEIEAKISKLSEMRDSLQGTIRITAPEHAARTILWPKVKQLMATYPDIRIELDTTGTLSDIVADRLDAGVRLGEQVAKDMIAIRIGPEYRMAVTASPEYWQRNGIPKAPKDLDQHSCVNIRFPTMGNIYAWELEKDGREVNQRVDGRLVLNNTSLIIDAAVSSLGIAFTIDEQVGEHLADGRLVRVMEEWCPPFAGYHLYYPSRRQLTPVMALLIDALRFTD